MRILLVAPWFRTLAVVHARVLESLGHDVLLVTTDAHYATSEVALPARSIVLPHTLRGASPVAFLRARWEITRFAAERSYLDDTWDARFAALAGRYALLVHDWAPHDTAHRTTAAKRTARRLVRFRARRFVFFSAAAAVAARRPTAPVLPLASELDAVRVDAVPGEETARVGAAPPVPRAPRPRLLALGRIEPYKQTGLVVDAWLGLTDDQRGGGTLVVMGDGSTELPPGAPGLEVRRGRYTFGEASTALAQSWASVFYYRGGTQSAAQVLSHAVGTPAILSDEPGLREYASPADRVVTSDRELPAALADVVRRGAPSSTEAAAVVAHHARTSGPEALARGWSALLAG